MTYLSSSFHKEGSLCAGFVPLRAKKCSLRTGTCICTNIRLYEVTVIYGKNLTASVRRQYNFMLILIINNHYYVCDVKIEMPFTVRV